MREENALDVTYRRPYVLLRRALGPQPGPQKLVGDFLEVKHHEIYLLR